MPNMNEKAPDTRAHCLGCRDCKGLCMALVEMALLPETLLKTSQVAR